jgi:hypothetical protein
MDLEHSERREKRRSVMHNPHEEEARERWGQTAAYQESSRRTRGYGDAEWAKIRAESEEIERGFADALAAGEPADGERATDLAEAARLHIDRWFYPCSREMHGTLAGMYTADERFKAHYDERADGLAAYVAAAIDANLSRAD